MQVDQEMLFEIILVNLPHIPCFHQRRVLTCA
jgi:hypothetical protein